MRGRLIHNKRSGEPRWLIRERQRWKFGYRLIKNSSEKSRVLTA
jgi:hypothetical protein